MPNNRMQRTARNAVADAERWEKGRKEMTKWEYKSVVGLLDGGLIKGWHLKSQSDEEVQKLGDAGWELVGLTDIGILGSTKNVLLVFKRPKE